MSALTDTLSRNPDAGGLVAMGVVMGLILAVIVAVVVVNRCSRDDDDDQP